MLSCCAVCQLVSPVFVYPVKLACLYSLYRFFSCSACYLSSTPPSLALNVVDSAVSASLAGFVVSLPHLSPRLSLMHVVGCGGVGAVASMAQLGLMWLTETARAGATLKATRDVAPPAIHLQAVADKRREVD